MQTVAEDDSPDPSLLRTDPHLPPVGTRELPRWTLPKVILWVAIAVIGAIGWTMVALVRGDHVNAIWFICAALGTYFIGYRFYGRFVERKTMRPDDRRATPAEKIDNGQDFVPTDRRVLFGHHFAAIAGAGPLVGPVLAAQMGYLPGTIWIIVGAVLAGCIQDMLVLFFSMRRTGRSIGQMARDELGVIGGIAALVGTFVIMLIIVAVLALAVVNALVHSPWGIVSIGLTIPIALVMGVHMRYWRPGHVVETSVIGVISLIAALIIGGLVASTSWGQIFSLGATGVAWCIIIYGFAAAILPVWVLLAPRDYLSTYMKVGFIVLFAAAIVAVRPQVQFPATTIFASTGTGPAFAGSLFPFLFITIACGALSGFHAMIGSGTTPKLIEKESQVRLIGYGSMMTESFVAIMALLAAVCLDQGTYFAMNASDAATGGTVQGAAAFVNSLPIGVHITPEHLQQVANEMGEQSIVSRSGGAPTLAVGMANILHGLIGGATMKAFWYHFAVLFEALFILSTVDAGTRVARFMLSDTLGNINKRFRDPSWRIGAWICTFIVVGLWGAVLLMGVTDPLGGIHSLFPLFGIANQLLAAIALAVLTAILFKQGRARWAWITALPLAFDVVTTFTASWLKIFSTDPKLGYWAQYGAYQDALAAGKDSMGATKGVAEMEAVVRNSVIQGSLSILFLVLVAVVVIMTIIVSVKAVRAGSLPTSEDPVVESRMFAPSGFVTTKLEKQVAAEWREHDRAMVKR